MNSKKIMAVLLSVVMGAAVLAGCGSSASGAAQAETKVEAKEAPKSNETAEELVEVGGDFPVSTKYAEYQLVEYYIEEMDETPVMVVARTADGKEYQAHFNFFGDEQLLEFTVDGDTPTVTNDLTGFMAKDIDKIYAIIKDSDNWKSVQ